MTTTAFFDYNRVTISDEVRMRARCPRARGRRPIDAKAQRLRFFVALAVAVGDGVWLGGRAVVCLSVTIGADAGRWRQERCHQYDAVAVGSPCRVIHQALKILAHLDE